jgi:hypothetical protein
MVRYDTTLLLRNCIHVEGNLGVWMYITQEKGSCCENVLVFVIYPSIQPTDCLHPMLHPHDEMCVQISLSPAITSFSRHILDLGLGLGVARWVWKKGRLALALRFVQSCRSRVKIPYLKQIFEPLHKFKLNSDNNKQISCCFDYSMDQAFWLLQFWGVVEGRSMGIEDIVSIVGSHLESR